MSIDTVCEEYEGELKYFIYNNLDKHLVSEHFISYSKTLKDYKVNNTFEREEYDAVFKLVTSYLTNGCNGNTSNHSPNLYSISGNYNSNGNNGFNH